MGNEQGKPADRSKPAARGFRAEEVSQMLDNQRRAYEMKLKLLKEKCVDADSPPPQAAREATKVQQNIRPHSPFHHIGSGPPAVLNPAASTTPSTSTSQPAREATVQQKLQQNIKIQSPLHQTGPGATAAFNPAASTIPSTSTSQSASSATERERTPYNYSEEELHKKVVEVNNFHRQLYPSLNNNALLNPVPAYVPLYHRMTEKNPCVRTDSEDFVIVDQNRNTPPERLQPTAPPALSPPSQAPSRRDRSVPRFRSQATNNEDEELNCRTCNKKYGLNIFQCRGGHSSCRDCRMRGANCGVCGAPVTDMRNVTLEAYISERKAPCPNSDDGCRLILKLADMDVHLKECPFNEMECPLTALFGRCYWRGKLSQMASHFSDVHPEHRRAEVDTEMRLMVIGKYHVFHLLLIGAYNFLLHIKVSDDKVYLTVQLIGTKTSASKWGYKVQMYNKAEPRKKFQFNNVCHSHATPINDIFQEAECVVLPFTYFTNYLNDGALTYKFYIKKEGEHSGNLRGVGRGGGRGRGRGAGRGARS